MQAIKEARRFIQKNADTPSGEIFAKLILALENETNFPIADIYKLDHKAFELAVRVIADWRLDRYYEGKGRLFDLSYQVANEMKKM